MLSLSLVLIAAVLEIVTAIIDISINIVVTIFVSIPNCSIIIIATFIVIIMIVIIVKISSVNYSKDRMIDKKIYIDIINMNILSMFLNHHHLYHPSPLLPLRVSKP